MGSERAPRYMSLAGGSAFPIRAYACLVFGSWQRSPPLAPRPAAAGRAVPKAEVTYVCITQRRLNGCCTPRRTCTYAHTQTHMYIHIYRNADAAQKTNTHPSYTCMCMYTVYSLT